MLKFKISFFCFILLFSLEYCHAQKAKLSLNNSSFQQVQNNTDDSKFQFKKIILPSIAIGYGFLALNNSTLIDWNENINTSLVGNKEVDADDFTIYMPIITTYAVDIFSKKAKHRFTNRTIILLTATVINNGITFGLKGLIDEKRPGEDKYNSFPSAHTSNAFMSAEFLRKEFKDVSPWYGVLGYGMAATTAYFRLYNNKHWFSDVVAGAGIGVLSTKIAYWTYYWMKKNVLKNKKGSANYDLSLSLNFNKKEPKLGCVVIF